MVWQKSNLEQIFTDVPQMFLSRQDTIEVQISPEPFAALAPHYFHTASHVQSQGGSTSLEKMLRHFHMQYTSSEMLTTGQQLSNQQGRK